MARKLIIPPSPLTARGTLSDVSAKELSKLEPGMWVIKDTAKGLPVGTGTVWRMALVVKEPGFTWAVMFPTPGGSQMALVVRASSAGNADWGKFDIVGIPS